jgi:hypothetical protein
MPKQIPPTHQTCACFAGVFRASRVLCTACLRTLSVMDIDTLFNNTVPQLIDDEGTLPWDANLTDNDLGCGGLTAEPASSEDFQRLAAMAEPLVGRYDDVHSAEWEQSPIGWIRQLSSAHKRGKIGEELVRAWATSEGFRVGGRGTRGHDCIIEGLKVEVKTSLRWNSNRFYFLALRDFDYDAVALLALDPNDVGLWVVPKKLLWQHACDQLRGASGEGSKWLAFRAGQPPAWLKPWGGTFAAARCAVRNLPAHSRGVDQEIERFWLEVSSDIEWPWKPEHPQPLPPEDSGIPITPIDSLDHAPAYSDSPPTEHLLSVSLPETTPLNSNDHATQRKTPDVTS